MNMEIARPANVSWLQVPGRQVLTVRTALSSMDGWPAVRASQPVPMLDWPSDLFEGASIDH
jgi:hypothetical protein